ncbi:MAG: hypothetical protein K0M45_01925 [Candidatus Paracaedibacteraceae bacterium]|nr:hypothetical protein [Candidatus Paracaedibacteraceae bacterium]
MTTQKILNSILLGVSLWIANVSAMDKQGFHNLYGVNTTNRQEMCQQSLEQLNAILEDISIDTQQTNQQIAAWLNSLKDDSLQYDNLPIVRTVNTINYRTGQFYIDDAIRGFNEIRENTRLLYQINKKNVAGDYVLGMVWTAINQYSAISGTIKMLI